jgi:hypothetical protein
MRLRFALLPLLLSACATTQAVSSGVKLDPDTRPACAANCEKMGLRLAAVVLVRNSAGCVCAVPEAKVGGGLGSEATSGALAVAGGVFIADEQDSQQLQMQEPPQAFPTPVPQ